MRLTDGLHAMKYVESVDMDCSEGWGKCKARLDPTAGMIRNAQSVSISDPWKDRMCGDGVGQIAGTVDKAMCVRLLIARKDRVYLSEISIRQSDG